MWKALQRRAFHARWVASRLFTPLVFQAFHGATFSQPSRDATEHLLRKTFASSYMDLSPIYKVPTIM
jgi:hypothetical protein